MKKFIEIIIPTYNRPHFLKETLASVLSQKLSDDYYLQVVVSDNSTNNETENYFANKNLPVKYIRRRPSLSGIEHIKVILKEVRGDYFMIFHDDDVMGDKMIETLAGNFDAGVVAVAGNAFMLRGIKKTNELFSKIKWKGERLLTEKKHLLELYLSKGFIFPFPGYIYRKEVSNIELDLSYGKHVDVYFLSRLLDYGYVKLMNVPLYFYRMHYGQDSFYSDFKAKSLLARLIIKECGLSRNQKVIKAFRLQIVYDELRTCLWTRNELSSKRVISFLRMCFLSFNFTLAAKMIYRIVQFKMR